MKLIITFGLFIFLIFNIIPPAFSETIIEQIAPELFIDKSACPFECCSYGNWTIDAKAPGYKSPDVNSEVVGYFQEGNIAYVGHGEAHVYKGKYIVSKVLNENTRFYIYDGRGGYEYTSAIRNGEVLDVYTYMGEGTYKVWRDGGFYNAALGLGGIEGEMAKEPVSTWWIYARSPLGWSGWSNEPYRFGNNKGCGGAYLWNVRVIYTSKEERIRTRKEISNYKKFIGQLDNIDTAKILGNGYAVSANNLNDMYVDLFLLNIGLMDVETRSKSVKELAGIVYNIASDLGISKEIKIKAMCNYCDEIKLDNK